MNGSIRADGALAGMKVLDFSTLLPGPLASLMLAEVGAEVTKIERPETGDPMREYIPRLGEDSANYVLLSRGKNVVPLDLKSESGRTTAIELACRADILIEQFRPGVMERLGLSYEVLRKLNPGLIYCSVSGYGQDGPKASRAAHDLNWMAEAGLLSLVEGKDGVPAMPATAVADVGGGSYPAVINILLALVERGRTGLGRHIDISMAESVLTFAYAAIADTIAGTPPVPSRSLVTGGSPRYNIYRTSDGRFLAAAPLEDRFWARFCELLGIDTAAGYEDVALVVAQRSARDWESVLSGEDVCCSIVSTVVEAFEDPQFIHRKTFDRRVRTEDGREWPAIPLPLAEGARRAERVLPAPPPLTTTVLGGAS